MDLKKIAARLGPYPQPGITGTTGITEDVTPDDSTTSSVIPPLYRDEGQYYTSQETGVCNTVYYRDTRGSITTQPVDSEGISGVVIPAIPVIPPEVGGHVSVGNFSGITPVAPQVITEAGQLESLLPLLCEAPLVGMDTETVGLNALSDRLRLLQVAVPGGPVLVVDTWQVPVQMVEPVFTATHVLAFHNAKFDLKMLVVALPLSVVKLTCIENGRLHRISW